MANIDKLSLNFEFKFEFDHIFCLPQTAFDEVLFHHRDRCRTMANVMGDSIGAGIVQHLSKHELMMFEDPESPDDTFQLHPAAIPSIAESRQL